MKVSGGKGVIGIKGNGIRLWGYYGSGFKSLGFMGLGLRDWDLGFRGPGMIRLMVQILHDPKDPKLWELWYIPYYGSCRILSINRRIIGLRFRRLGVWGSGL